MIVTDSRASRQRSCGWTGHKAQLRLLPTPDVGTGDIVVGAYTAKLAKSDYADCETEVTVADS